jgi:hypothetical protein
MGLLHFYLYRLFERIAGREELYRPISNHDVFALFLAAMRLQIFVNRSEPRQKGPWSGGENHENVHVKRS